MKRFTATLLSPFIFAGYYLLCITCTANVQAQSPQSMGSAEIFLALRKLNVLGSVLYIAAHPDDENTRLITYLSKEKLYRTGYLSMTRGDGGQNLIGNEQGIELGLIRTQELLAARRVDGGEQFFNRAFDFGYSKNPEETFTKWNKEKILSDVVWVIRTFQPDVIITRFPATGEGGHGHHTGSAILANEAFIAAADSARFPEQLHYVKPWQAKRILWNTFNFGGNNTITADQFRIDVGGFNPLLGKSYGEIAAESRSQHKSQGFGVPASIGEAFESFKPVGGQPPVHDLMDDVITGWGRVPGGEKIEQLVNGLITSFDLVHPEKSVSGLVILYNAINALPAGYWKTQKLTEVQYLIEQCSGLFIEATTGEPFAVQTDSIRVNFLLNNRLGVPALLKRISADIIDSTFNQPLLPNRNTGLTKKILIPESKPITQPYWLVNMMEEGYFNVSDQQKIGQPDVDPAYLVHFILTIEGHDFTFTRLVKYKHTDPVKGELYQPLYVIPRATIMSSPSFVLFKDNEPQEKEVQFRFNANGDFPPGIKFYLRTYDTLQSFTDSNAYNKYQSGNVFFRINNDSRINEFKKRKKQEKQLLSQVFKNSEQNNPAVAKQGIIYPYAQLNDSTGYYLSVRAIDYDHIPSIKYFFTDVIRTAFVDIKTRGKKIGYIIGAGDKVPEALEQMGYEVTLLTEKELSRNNLQQFDAIISGVRAYNTNEWLNKYFDKLMKYIYYGGNYIVQYNTSNFISSIKNKIGPYDFTISRSRITDEQAAVNFLQPGHPVLNYPNKISADDFKGWIQERSIYHAGTRNKNFESVLSMKDPGEKPDDGSLVIARYGKGYFTYTGLVFFRELPAGVAGAYRLMANLIALNKKK